MAYKEIALTAANEVKISINYLGTNQPVIASYTYQLKDSDANPPLEYKQGDNQNSADDVYYLPNPIASNKRRFILISSEVVAIEHDTEFEIEIDITQDGGQSEKMTIKGKVMGDGDTVNKLAMIKFI
jgi:hypothetical protein